MDGDTLYSIGDLARRTGLTVKAIRFYSDCGIVPPTDRSPAGYRLYDIDAVARLDLVRTLRDLGLDLPTIRKVVDREISLAEVAAAHAEALAVQIRTLRLRRAVLTAVARRGSTPEEMDLMHKLAKLSEDERRRLIGDFLDAAFGGLGADPIRGDHALDDPRTARQPRGRAGRGVGGAGRAVPGPGFPRRHAADGRAACAERARAPRACAATSPRRSVTEVGPALAAGVDPASPQADAVVAAVTAEYARLSGRPDDADLRRRLLTRVETANDPRRERYLQLLAVINGWIAPESLAPVFDWFTEAAEPRPASAA